MTEHTSDRSSMVTGYGYFVLRLQLAPPSDPPTYAGVIERLGTGERRRFENADDLLRLLGAWPGTVSKNDASAAPDATSDHRGM